MCPTQLSPGVFEWTAKGIDGFNLDPVLWGMKFDIEIALCLMELYLFQRYGTDRNT
jgi:hypothetical protein